MLNVLTPGITVKNESVSPVSTLNLLTPSRAASISTLSITKLPLTSASEYPRVSQFIAKVKVVKEPVIVILNLAPWGLLLLIILVPGFVKT